jgi:hypothetical protein
MIGFQGFYLFPVPGYFSQQFRFPANELVFKIIKLSLIHILLKTHASDDGFRFHNQPPVALDVILTALAGDPDFCKGSISALY